MKKENSILSSNSKSKKCWIFFHNWENIYRNNISTFEGVKYNDPSSTNFRKCSICGYIQEYQFDSQGGSWMYLSKIQTKILNQKIKRINRKLLIPKINNPGEE